MRPVLCYECWFSHAPWRGRHGNIDHETVYAFSSGAAKARYLRLVREFWGDIPFIAIRARRLKEFPEDANLTKICKYRGIPTLRAGKSIVSIGGKIATAIGANDSANINVIYETGTTGSVHPNGLTVISL